MIGDGILELVNPTIVETDGEQIGPEGCLSVPGKYGLVKRPYYAKVRAQDRYLVQLQLYQKLLRHLNMKHLKQFQWKLSQQYHLL